MNKRQRVQWAANVALYCQILEDKQFIHVRVSTLQQQLYYLLYVVAIKTKIEERKKKKQQQQ